MTSIVGLVGAFAYLALLFASMVLQRRGNPSARLVMASSAAAAVVAVNYLAAGKWLVAAIWALNVALGLRHLRTARRLAEIDARTR